MMIVVLPAQLLLLFFFYVFVFFLFFVFFFFSSFSIIMSRRRRCRFLSCIDACIELKDAFTDYYIQTAVCWIKEIENSNIYGDFLSFFFVCTFTYTKKTVRILKSACCLLLLLLLFAIKMCRATEGGLLVREREIIHFYIICPRAKRMKLNVFNN
jgi:hypothetical protein